MVDMGQDKERYAQVSAWLRTAGLEAQVVRIGGRWPGLMALTVEGAIALWAIKDGWWAFTLTENGQPTRWEAKAFEDDLEPEVIAEMVAIWPYHEADPEVARRSVDEYLELKRGLR